MCNHEGHHHGNSHSPSDGPPRHNENYWNNTSADPQKDPKKYFLKVFYYNPEDKSLIVPMRYGSGVDFNYARWPGRTVIILLLLGILWILFTSISG